MFTRRLKNLIREIHMLWAYLHLRNRSADHHPDLCWADHFNGEGCGR